MERRTSTSRTRVARGGPRPGAFVVQGFDWGGRTGRGGLAVAALAVGTPAAALAWGPGLVAGWSRLHEALLTVTLALLLVPAAGHAARRLNDVGGRGWWAWLLLIPWARLLLLALLLGLPPSQRRPRPGGLGRALGPGVAGVAALVLLGSLLWTTAGVAGQDMAPTLRPGDLALVRRAPVALARGDVIVFAGDGGARVARLIARGGERVAMTGGVPVIDGVPARQAPDGFFAETYEPQGPARVLPLCGNGTVGLGAACTTRRAVETLPGGASHAVLDARPGPGDDVAEILVPPGHLWVLGDHRDAAADSRRVPAAGGAGLVPASAVIGRVSRVLVSSAAASPWDPRGWRLGRTGRRVE